MALDLSSGGEVDLPLGLFARADGITAGIGASEWRLASRREQGRSHALILSAGRGAAKLAQGQLQLSGPALLWLPPAVGQVIQVQPGSQGLMLSFAEDLVARAVSGQRAPNELRAVADRLIHAEGAGLPDRIAGLTHAASAIHGELRHLAEGGMHIVVAHLTVILVHAWRLSGIHVPPSEANWSGSVIYQRFLHAVELHFRENWPVAHYASQLGVTERRLHSAVTKASGKSPLQLVHSRILVESCARLEQSSLPIAQIGYGLGFRDPAHFSRFFKNAMGMSPGAFRRRRRREADWKDMTYAAWP
jgi:AraC family transcriptional activator of pobA